MFPSTFITGPAGQLELAMPVTLPTANMPIGVICHPHPLQGGTMTNKVVTTVARAWLEQGAYPILFNYRGVGKSAGSYGEGIGEAADAIAVVDWAQTQWPTHALWLAGFSFGAHVSLLAAQQYPQLAKLITIAPAVNHQAYGDLRVHCPWQVIAAGQDDIVPLSAIQTWISALVPSPAFNIIPAASHFFSGQLLTLRDLILQC